MTVFLLLSGLLYILYPQHVDIFCCCSDMFLLKDEDLNKFFRCERC